MSYVSLLVNGTQAIEGGNVRYSKKFLSYTSYETQQKKKVKLITFEDHRTCDLMQVYTLVYKQIKEYIESLSIKKVISVRS